MKEGTTMVIYVDVYGRYLTHAKAIEKDMDLNNLKEVGEVSIYAVPIILENKKDIRLIDGIEYSETSITDFMDLSSGNPITILNDIMTSTTRADGKEINITIDQLSMIFVD